MNIPFLDLKKQYLEIKNEVDAAIFKVLDDQQFIQGKHCCEFENKFNEIQGLSYGVGCSNGTSAIYVALKCLDVKPGDEVITVNNTFFATVEAIVECGATPVLVDCDPITYQIDTEKLRNAITSKTKVIIPVHLYGNPADMISIMDIASKHSIKVVEDCAQAHLATIGGRGVGSFGDFSTFSFYPGKNLGAYGDAGFIGSNSEELINKAKMYINHGRMDKYEHQFCAGNFRMDGIQASVLNVKLKYITKWTARRREIAKQYDMAFDGLHLGNIKTYENSLCSYHLYVIRSNKREKLQQILKEKNIATGIHYPVAMSEQPAMNNYSFSGLTTSESYSKELVSLPMCPYLSNEQIDYVSSSVINAIDLL